MRVKLAEMTAKPGQLQSHFPLTDSVHTRLPLSSLEQKKAHVAPGGLLEPRAFEDLIRIGIEGVEADISMELGCQKLEKCSRKAILYTEMGMDVVIILSLSPQRSQ